METVSKILEKWKTKTPKQCLDITAKAVQKLTRLQHADDEGYCTCVTCGVKKKWNDIDSGHMISRRLKATIFEKTNQRPQCKKCNRFQNGRYPEYVLWYKEEYGERQFFELLHKSQQHKKWTKPELAEIYYKAKLGIRKHEHRLNIR